MRTKRLKYIILCLTIAFIPFHYYICDLLFKNTRFDNLFRDFLIFLLLLLSISSGKFRVNRTGIYVAIFVVILTLYAIFSYLLIGYPGTMNIYRTYLLPLLIYYTASTINLNKCELTRIHKIIYLEMVSIAAYGLFQAFVLGDDFIISLGYSGTGGYLSSSSFYIGGYFGYQRVTGVFVSPNICGVILGIALIICLLYGESKKKYISSLSLLILIIGLLGTFSRTSMLGVIIAFIFIKVVGNRTGRWLKISRKALERVFMIMVLGILIFFVVDFILLDRLFSSMLLSSFSGMFSLSDSSAQKHLEDLVEPIIIVLNNPFGLGFGNNGPMALENSSHAVTVESSFYLMMYEVGIVGAVFCFAPYFSVIYKTVKNKAYKYYVPACVTILCLFSYLLLPNIQTYEITFYAYLFIGLYNNKSIREIWL